MTDPSANPLADREQRLALFQMWFSDTIPHSKALGIKIIDARRGFASMRLEWREGPVGQPGDGLLAPRPPAGAPARRGGHLRARSLQEHPPCRPPPPPPRPIEAPARPPRGRT